MKHLIAVTCAIMCACGPTMVVEEHTPMLNTGSEKIAITQTQNAVMGTVGEHHDGVLAITQYSWVIGSNLSATYPVVVTDMIRNEMQISGYDVINMTTTILTSSMQEGLSLSLGSTITSMNVQTYGPLCGSKSNATVEIRFDITELETGTQVYSQIFQGNASASGEDPVSGISMAAQNATRAFLANEQAASVLSGNY